MNYYAARTAREAKEDPRDWLILPGIAGHVELVQVRSNSARPVSPSLDEWRTGLSRECARRILPTIE